MPKSNDEGDAYPERLYGLPLDEFTVARDGLARSLRAEGRGDEAAAVKRLRKPTVAAWALNQVRRNDPERVEALIDAGRRLGEAQQRLLAGGGREALDRAVDEERQLVAELARRAERELAGSGRPASAAVQEKLRATLQAVATDAEARDALAAGRLVGDHAATGLGPLLEGSGGASRPGRAPEGRRPATGHDRAAARKARELTQKLERARARQQEAEAMLADARRRLEEAREEAAQAAAALKRAETAERRARERAQQAAERTAQVEEAAKARDAR